MAPPPKPPLRAASSRTLADDGSSAGLGAPPAADRVASFGAKAMRQATTTSLFRGFGSASPPKTPQAPHIVSLVRLLNKVDLKTRMNVHGYNERLNAAESVVFLVRAFRVMRPRLLKAAGAVAPESGGEAGRRAKLRSRVEALERYMVQVCRELRVRTHKTIGRLFIDHGALVQGVAACKWDKNELSSRNHEYVDELVAQLRDAAAVVGAHGDLPPHIERNVWREAVSHVMRSLVDAYARLRKCTTEGRASMSLDLNVLRNQATKLAPSHLKQLPLWEFVNDFVKAFYLPEDDLCKWVAEHPGYTLAQYRNVAAVGAGASMRSKRRDRLLQRVEAVVRGGEFTRNSRAFDEKQANEDAKLYHTL